MMMTDHPCVSVTRVGVTEINSRHDSQLRVNDRDIVVEVEKAMEKAGIKPVTDYEDRFAARVRVIVEFLGDMETGGDHAD